MKEIREYRQFTAPAELHKAVNTLRGIMAGITSDSGANSDEITEISNWCQIHSHLQDRHPFNELIPLLESIHSDGVVTEDEAADVVWLCNNFISDANYYDIITSSIQFLSGVLHGIMADGFISDSEIYSLEKWLNLNKYLSGCYPFDEIQSLINAVLLDGKITDDERNILAAFFGNFVDFSTSANMSEKKFNDLKEKYSVGGICVMCQGMKFDDKVFCFTGMSERAKRSDVEKIIIENGGTFKANVTKDLDYLVVGNGGNPCWAYACYGRKIEEAVQLRETGSKLLIVNEIDFWEAVEDAQSGI